MAKDDKEQQAPQVEAAEVAETELEDIAGGGGANSSVEHNGSGYSKCAVLNN